MLNRNRGDSYLHIVKEQFAFNIIGYYLEFVTSLSANELLVTILTFIHLFSPSQAILDHIWRSHKKHFNDNLCKDMYIR